jgi:hypothetical protein
MVHEWKKVINEERLHLVESMIPLLDHKDEELQEALEVSRHEVEFQRRTVERYEHGSGSGGGGVRGFFRRATSHRERFRNFDVARARVPMQTQIDTHLWTSKG